MPLLHVALQEGFKDDSVRISVNGRQVYQREGVSTRLQIGLADSLELQVAGGDTRVQVSVPTRSSLTSFTLTCEDDTYVGVSLDPDGRIRHRESATPFGYL